MDSVAISPSAPIAAAVGHSCECLCATCERQCSGAFAQRALLAGDAAAADRLAPAIAALLGTPPQESSMRLSSAGRTLGAGVSDASF